MAKLSDFLGGLVSSICDARVKSDIQSVKIAEEYSRDNLLQHFAVPRMRVDKVELNIPVAIDTLFEKMQEIYEPIDSNRFSAKTYQLILKSLEVTTLSKEHLDTLNTTIAENIKLLELKIRVDQIESGLKEVSQNIASKVVGLVNAIYEESERRKLTKLQLSNLKKALVLELQSALKNEIILKSETKVLESLQVIVEADKLREVKPENIIMIKMTISEQGMEWVKMENNKGEVITKLMPE